jgi:hypothetical protein
MSCNRLQLIKDGLNDNDNMSAGDAVNFNKKYFEKAGDSIAKHGQFKCSQF